MSDGIFTQPGPDGVFGRGGPPNDASSPTIDSDGTDLRQTLVVAFPSPGHMRVARGIRHPNGRVEFQEQYREPTEDEKAFLARQNITVGPGSMVTSGQQPGSMSMSGIPEPDSGSAPGSGVLSKLRAQPWLKLIGAVAVGAAGLWAAQKWGPGLVEKFGDGGDDGDDDDDDGDDGDDEGDED